MITIKRLLSVATVLAVILIQLSSAARALADDGVTPEETPVVSPTEDPPAAPDPSETPEATPTEELTPTEPASDPTEEITPEETVTPDLDATATPDLEETVAPDPEETATPDPEETVTPDPEETVTPDPECVPADAVEGAESVENGDSTIPVCEEAAEVTVSYSDPVWCPAGQVPGGAGCTPSQPSITALINFLIANPTLYTGNGAIYFQTGDYTGTETYIRIDYTVLPQLGTISVLGGWDLDPAGGYSGNTGTTTFDVPVEVVWDTDVTLADVTVNLVGTPSEGSEVGVFVSTGGDVTLDNVDVQGGSYGAYVNNSGGSGNVTVRGVSGDNSVFSGNTNYGLMIYSSGSVTLAYVTASGNLTGIYIDNSNGTAGVNAGNIFVDGNSWTGIDIRSIGDIILDAVTESGSTVGANLQSTAGIGNIFVSNSTFTGNSSVGIRAVTNEGDISLTIVTTDNSDTPGSFGAWLKSYGGGTITVTDSTFNNADTGLFIVGTGNVFLNNVTADSNLGDGAVVESGWVFGCFGPDGIAVTITDGSYQDNGGYGFVVYPGPKGSVTLAGTIAMQGNTAGENNIDLIRTCVPVEEKPAKPYQVVEVTGRGDDPVQPDCELYSGALLILPDQSRVKVACPVEEPITVAEVAKDKLPGDPPKSFVVIAGLVVTAGESDLLPTGSWMQLCFKIPDGMEGKHFAILYWDTAANGGAGGWIEMPMNQFGGQVFSLHPDTPEDGMKILEGVYQKGNSICVKVNFTGTFILVAR